MAFPWMAVAALAGGAADRRQRNKDAKANSAAGVRADAEAAGFNPIFWANTGRSATAGYAPVFGNAIANAGAALSTQRIEESKLKIQQDALQMDRDRLDMEIEHNRLQPTVGGIYARSRVETGGDTNASSDMAPEGVFSSPMFGFPDGFPYLGYDVDINPNTADAEVGEQRYGDLVSSVYGVGVVGADLYHNNEEYINDITGNGLSTAAMVGGYYVDEIGRRVKRTGQRFSEGFGNALETAFGVNYDQKAVRSPVEYFSPDMHRPYYISN